MKAKKKEEIKVSYLPEFCCKDAEEAQKDGFIQFIQGPLTGSAAFFIANKAGRVKLVSYCPWCGSRAENVEGKEQRVDDVADVGE